MFVTHLTWSVRYLHNYDMDQTRMKQWKVLILDTLGAIQWKLKELIVWRMENREFQHLVTTLVPPFQNALRASYITRVYVNYLRQTMPPNVSFT